MSLGTWGKGKYVSHGEGGCTEGMGLGRGCGLEKTFPRDTMSLERSGAKERMWAEEKMFPGEMGRGRIHSLGRRWAWGGDESLGMDNG
jgi:hypothetical protein